MSTCPAGCHQARRGTPLIITTRDGGFPPQLNSSRQELAHALYTHDAAMRVIARLTKERDEARSALAAERAAPGAGAKRASDGDAMDTEQVPDTTPRWVTLGAPWVTH